MTHRCEISASFPSAPVVDQEALTLIWAYRSAAREAARNLREGFGGGSLLDAVRRDPSLRAGVLVNGADYFFHGFGCRYTYEGRTLEFDFGPFESVSGFDAWRLWSFAAEEPDVFPRWQSEHAVECALHDLVRAGLVHAPRWEPSEHLLFLTERGEDAAGPC